MTTAAGPRDLVRFRARVGGGLDDVKVYLGPKQYDILARADREMVPTINFGMFAWLVVPLLQALNWIDRFVGNYGWSIIVLTLLINGAAPMRQWRKAVFAFMSRNAANPAGYFDIPPNRVVELGAQIRL